LQTYNNTFLKKGKSK